MNPVPASSKYREYKKMFRSSSLRCVVVVGEQQVFVMINVDIEDALLVVLVFFSGALVLVVSKHGRLRYGRGRSLTAYSAFSRSYRSLSSLAFLSYGSLSLAVSSFHFSPNCLPTSPAGQLEWVYYMSGVDEMRLTKLDAWVIFSDLVAVVVGEEHVRTETSLWRVGVWEVLKLDWMKETSCKPLPFFLFPSTLDLALRALTSFGMIAEERSWLVEIQ